MCFMAGKKASPRNDDSDIKKRLEKLERGSDKRRQITRSRRLKELQDKLEGSHKVERVKNLKRKSFILQIFGIIVLFPFLMYFDGVSFNPLYLPIYHSLLMLFGWVLIIFISSFIFRILIIKRHRSYSTKYLLARNSMRKSITLAVIALIIFGVLYTPYLTEMVNEVSSVEEKIITLENEDSENFEAEIELTNRCILNLRGLKSLTIEHAGNTVSEINITLYEKKDGERETVISRNIDDENSNVTFQEDELNTGAFKVWIFHLSSTDRSAIEYNIRREVFPSRQTSFSLLSFLYLGVFLQSAAVLYPIKKRYTGKGIYR